MKTRRGPFIALLATLMVCGYGPALLGQTPPGQAPGAGAQPAPGVQPGAGVQPVPGGAPPAGTPATPPGAPATQPPGAQPAPPAAGGPAGPGEIIRDRYPDGNIRIERHVVQDQIGNYVNHGPWTSFYSDGNKVGGGQFNMGKREGKWVRTFAPGEGELFASPVYRGFQPPFQSIATFVSGQIEGPWVITDKNGQVMSEWSFRAGRQHGDWIWYLPNGQKSRHVVYLDGEINGKVFEWGQDGKVSSNVEYIKGRRRELRRGFYGPNVKHWEGWYLHPKERTKTTYDWWLGVAATEVVGVDGPPERDGVWTWWFPNQQKQVEGSYVLGKPHGPWTWWHPNGQKWIEGEYVMSQKSGKWTTFAESGAVENTELLPVVDPATVGAQPAAGAPPASAGPGAAGGGGAVPAGAPAQGVPPGGQPAGQPAPSSGAAPSVNN